MLSVIMLSVIMVSVIMVSVIMLSVIMLNVGEPLSAETVSTTKKCFLGDTKESKFRTILKYPK
jgi:hypothetical protein